MTSASASGWERAGRRFGNVLHIDLAFPLNGDKDIDSVQLVVETKAQF